MHAETRAGMPAILEGKRSGTKFRNRNESDKHNRDNAGGDTVYQDTEVSGDRPQFSDQGGDMGPGSSERTGTRWQLNHVKPRDGVDTPGPVPGK